MRFLMFLLVFIMVGFSAFCQEHTDSQLSHMDLKSRQTEADAVAPPKLGDAVKPADAITSLPKRRERSCPCTGKKIKRKCVCKYPSKFLTMAQKTHCKKIGISTSRKCRKQYSTSISTPV